MKKRKMLVVLVAGVAIATMIALAACGQSTGGDSADGGSSQSTAEFTWSSDSDCTQCHSTEAASMLDKSANICASHSDLSCMTCHDDADGLAEAHTDVTLADGSKTPAKLKETEVRESVCFSCHGSWEQLAAKTTDVTVLTDGNGTLINPHEVTTKYMVNDNHAKITCSSCHKMHASTTPGDAATQVCASCHHAGVYQCYTCH